MSHPFAITGIGIVTVLTAVLTVIALRAWRVADDRRLLFLAAAFGLFAIKSGITSISIALDLIDHEMLEIMISAFDLAIVGFLIAPLFAARRR